jgi:phage regulator Rha-like protein
MGGNSRMGKKKELVTIQNDRPVTSSVLVAEEFGRNHKELLRTIRNMLKDFEPSNDEGLGGRRKFALSSTPPFSWFFETTYTNLQNKEQPMFLITKEGFQLLLGEIQTKKARQIRLGFVLAFQKAEQSQKIIQSLSEQNQKLVNQVETLVNKNQELNERVLLLSTPDFLPQPNPERLKDLNREFNRVIESLLEDGRNRGDIRRRLYRDICSDYEDEFGEDLEQKLEEYKESWLRQYESKKKLGPVPRNILRPSEIKSATVYHLFGTNQKLCQRVLSWLSNRE